MAASHLILSAGAVLLKTLLILLQGLMLLVAGIVAYRLTLHPLANVPGPKLAAISNIWYAYQARNGYAHLLGKTLHEQYGPVVRVGPNELWFNTKEAFDAIYGMLDKKSALLPYHTDGKLGTGSKSLDKSDFYCEHLIL